MRYLVYSDLQADDGQTYRFNSPERLQLWRVREFYKRLHLLFKQHECDAVIDLGDTTDNRSHISIPVIEAISEGIAPYRGLDNLKLIGNHEQWLKSGHVHVGGLFNQAFRIIPSIEKLEVEGKTLLFASYPPEGESEMIDVLDSSKADMIFGHFQIAGAKGSSGLLPGGVPAACLSGFKIGLYGHIHGFQEVIPNHFYLGSPFEQDFGEANSNKYVALVDVVADRPVAITWLPIDGFPKHHVVTLLNWLKSVSDSSEDRYRVTLRSPEEAAKFYAHPLAYRAETSFLYEEVTRGNTSEGNLAEAEPEDFERIYVKSVPFDHISKKLTVEGMLKLGRDISCTH